MLIIFEVHNLIETLTESRWKMTASYSKNSQRFNILVKSNKSVCYYYVYPNGEHQIPGTKTMMFK